jgi:hypothetical protein
MTQQDLERSLRSKYDARAVDNASTQLARRVLAIPAQSPPSRGWLPRLTNGGITHMFSATRMVAALAVMGLSGGLLFGSLAPGGDQEAPAGAATGTVSQAPGPVTGTIVGVNEEEFESTSLGGGMFKVDNQAWSVRWEADDPRLNGSGNAIENGFQHFQTYTGLYANAWTISNEDGTWVGTGNHFSSPDGGRDFVVFEGGGGYEGLTAFVAIGADVWTGTADDTRAFEGVIFPGELPAQPDPLPLE